MLPIITAPVHLHVLGCPWVLVYSMLDILHFSFRFLPRRLVPFRPVDVALCKLHLQCMLAFFLTTDVEYIKTYHVSPQIIFLLSLESSQILHHP
jgi:hypothetical protein